MMMVLLMAYVLVLLDTVWSGTEADAAMVAMGADSKDTAPLVRCLAAAALSIQERHTHLGYYMHVLALYPSPLDTLESAS